jgi:hypothetical protein
MELQIKKLSFISRPISIPADYRPMYKISLIVLVLKVCCRSEKASLLKLHLFSWALKSISNMEMLRSYIISNFKKELSVWNIEPALNRAIQFAIAEGICDVVDGKAYRLTEKGTRLYNMITSENDLFTEEKNFLSFVGKNKITDQRIELMSKQWAFNYVED